MAFSASQQPELAGIWATRKLCYSSEGQGFSRRFRQTGVGLYRCTVRASLRSVFAAATMGFMIAGYLGLAAHLPAGTPAPSKASRSAASSTEQDAQQSWLGTSRRSSTAGKPQSGHTTDSGSPSRAVVNPESVSARLQRRLEVCDRLKMLALETKDVRLEQAVSDLENLVWQWYWQEQPRHPASPKAPGTSRDAVPSSSTTAPQNNPSASPKTSADKEPTLSGTSVTPGRAYRTDWAIRGIPAHERLDRTDMHTVRGCSLDHSLPVVELAPRFPSSPNQEIRR